jgi:putative FmdB family regulatory protein
VPIYEYKCPNGHLFETFHGMMEPSPEVCEVCGAGPLQRVLHPVAVHYKGSGFYSTDYGRKSKKPAKDGGSEGSGSSDGGGSGDSSGSGDSAGSGDSGGSSGSGSSGSSESSGGGKKAAEA